MSVFFQLTENKIIVSGKTYVHREVIKSLGAQFDGQDKTWILSNTPEVLSQVKKLCAETGGGGLGDLLVKSSDLPIGQSKSVFGKLAEDLASPTEAIKTRAQGAMASLFGEDEPVGTLVKQPRMAESKSLLPEAESPGFTIAELVDRARIAIQSAFPQTVWVIGEIQSLNRRKGAVFFNLAEAKANGSQTSTMTINATMWQGALSHIAKQHGPETLNDMLAEGLEGRFLCQVTLYRDRGTLSLNIVDVDPKFTKGALALAREKLLKELRQEGLDQVNKRLPFAAFPLVIGLISADDSRAKSDFLHQLWAYQYPGRVIFYQAQMQGEQVASGVVRGISDLAGHCDAIVITRGGGSAADLRWFDSKEIALAIAHAKVPIICAIGHQDDVCVAEEVAFRREKTPTAAADFIVHKLSEVREFLTQAGYQLNERLASRIKLAETQQSALRERLTRAFEAQLSLKQDRLRSLVIQIDQSTTRLLHQHQSQLLVMAKAIPANAMQSIHNLEKIWQTLHHRLAMVASDKLSAASNGLYQIAMSFRFAQQNFVTQSTQKIELLRSSLEAKDPTSWIEKGWTRLYQGDRSIMSAADVDPDAEIRTRLRDGQLILTLKRIEKRTSP